MAFLTVAEFRVRSTMPSTDLDALEVSEPGFIAAKLDEGTDWIKARLRKRRYSIPSAAPYPPVLQTWLNAIVTLDCYVKRGFDPSAKSDQIVIDAAKTARAEVLEAADSKEGLFDLPLSSTDDSSGVDAESGVLGYSEISPYVWTDLQADNAEDRQ